MFKSIKTRFITLTVLFILFSVGIPTVFLIVQFRANFQQRSVVMLETTMDVLQNGLNNAMMLGKQKNIYHILNYLAQNKSIDHIRIFSESGIILFSSDSTEIGQSFRHLSPGHVDFSRLDQERISLLDNHKTYSLIMPMKNEERCQPCHGLNPVIAYLDIDTNLTRAEMKFFTGSLHIIFLGLVIVIVLVVGFYSIFSHYINKPLKNFTTALEEVKQGNLSVRLPAMRRDEFGLIEDHFNRMVTNLENSKRRIEELHFEQLKRADKLVTLGELAAEMAHEINNPVGVIQSHADYLILEAEKSEALEDYCDELNIILTHTEKIAKITRNILKYSKKLPIDFRTFNLVSVVHEALDILRPRLDQKGITTETDIHEENVRLFGDPHQIEQVLTNLINNSIDAMEHGGKLTVAIRPGPGNAIHLSIHDEGTGMDAHTLENIFTPFFTTKPGMKGTGLGLYIVKNICKNHRAEIHCTSNPDQGTTFTITFERERIEKTSDH